MAAQALPGRVLYTYAYLSPPGKRRFTKFTLKFSNERELQLEFVGLATCAGHRHRLPANIQIHSPFKTQPHPQQSVICAGCRRSINL